MITKTRLSVLAMLVIAALSVTYMFQNGLTVGALTKTKSASFVVPESNGLLTGSRVLVNGVESGHVTAVRPVTGGVRVEWNYGDDRRIPADSDFRVDNLSALGEAYVAVRSLGLGAPYLADGAQIESDRVSVPTPFNVLSERLTILLRQVDPDQVGSIFETLHGSLPQDLSVVDDLNTAGRLLAAEFEQQADSLTTLLSTLQPLLARTGDVPASLAATTPELQAFGEGFRDMLDSIRDAVNLGGPLLVGVTDGASPFLAELQSFLDNTAEDLNVIGENVLPAARAGAAALSAVDLGRFLTQALAATSKPGAITVEIPAG
ncbi:MAG: MlaD family protein [Gordonia sp. (in: high G+C Gram-positive bacteria)]|uniref:MlaD family protein n=1 Tax=Gordonia sp. (in: high G+C Gram-positive bacteria) TaxID=84139 RepID=UPI003BB60C5C